MRKFEERKVKKHLNCQILRNYFIPVRLIGLDWEKTCPFRAGLGESFGANLRSYKMVFVFLTWLHEGAAS